MAKKKLLSIIVHETAPKKYLITASFRDAPAITVDTKDPKQAMMQVAMQAMFYLIMHSQGNSTYAHAPLPKAFLKKLKKDMR